MPLRSPLIGALLALAILASCRREPVTYIPYLVAKTYRAEQKPRLLKPGWRLTEVARRADRPTVIVHRVEVIPELAGDLVIMGPRKRRRLVGELVCPGPDHSIWSELTRAQDVEADLATEKRGVFATISCRRAVRGRRADS